MRTIEQMVQMEVLCSVSSLISTLARSYGTVDATRGDYSRDLCGLTDQAFELASPIDDFEEAAIEAGWTFVAYAAPDQNDMPGYWWRRVEDGDENDAEETAKRGFPCSTADTAEWACDQSDAEPHQREVFEHWAVTSWFGAKLRAAGEKVDDDFGGLCVWARTTTGQAIHADHVIEQVYAATHFDGDANEFRVMGRKGRPFRAVYGAFKLDNPHVLGIADTLEGATEIVRRWRGLATGPEADAIRDAHP